MKYKFSFVIILLLFFVSIQIFSATPKDFINLEGEEYVAFAEKMAAPVGGISAVLKNVEYPEFAQNAKIQGKVYVMAFINENGDVDDVKVIRGIGGGCDEAAVKAVKKSKFVPANNKGQNIKVKYTIPISFKL